MKTLALACLVLSASIAAANPRHVEAEAAYKYGQSLYLKEDYVGAAAQFKAAYDLEADPVYLFNIAQAFRLAKRCKESGDYYRKFLGEVKKAPNEDAVKAYIVEVDECAKTQLVEPKPAEPPIEPQPQPIAQPQMIDEPPPKSNKRLVGYIVGGAGVATVGLGFLFMTQIAGFEDDANAICPNPCMTWDPVKRDRRNAIDDKAALREKLMVGSFLVGGAAIAAGVYLIVTGGEPHESGVAITPTRNGAMVSLKF